MTVVEFKNLCDRYIRLISPSTQLPRRTKINVYFDFLNVLNDLKQKEAISQSLAELVELAWRDFYPIEGKPRRLRRAPAA